MPDIRWEDLNPAEQQEYLADEEKAKALLQSQGFRIANPPAKQQQQAAFSSMEPPPPPGQQAKPQGMNDGMSIWGMIPETDAEAGAVSRRTAKGWANALAGGATGALGGARFGPTGALMGGAMGAFSGVENDMTTLKGATQLGLNVAIPQAMGAAPAHWAAQMPLGAAAAVAPKYAPGLLGGETPKPTWGDAAAAGAGALISFPWAQKIWDAYQKAPATIQARLRPQIEEAMGALTQQAEVGEQPLGVQVGKALQPKEPTPIRVTPAQEAAMPPSDIAPVVTEHPNAVSNRAAAAQKMYDMYLKLKEAGLSNSLDEFGDKEWKILAQGVGTHERTGMVSEATRNAVKALASGKPIAAQSAALKPLHEQTISELDQTIQNAKSADAADLEALFGKEGAIKYRRLERSANSSMDTAKADQASREMQAMEDALPEEGRNRLFGIGQKDVVDVESAKQMRSALGRIDGTSPEELADSLKWAVSAFDPKNPLGDPVRYAQLRHAAEIAQKNGWDTKQIMRRAYAAAANRFSNPDDALLMLGHLRNPSTAQPRSVAPAAPPPAAAAMPEPVGTAPATPVNLDTDAALEALKKNPTQHVANLVSNDEGLRQLPQLLRAADEKLPDVNMRGHVRNEMINQVFTGINKSGTPEDLTNIQRYLSFGKKQFGDKSGAAIINEVFENPDAYRKMQELSTAMETSQMAKAAGKTSPIEAWWQESKGTAPALILKIATAGGAAFGLSHQLPITGLAIAGATAAGPATKLVFKVPPEAVGRWLSGRSKIPDILADLIEGNAHKYPAAMIAQIIGQIRRSADEETQETVPTP